MKIIQKGLFSFVRCLFTNRSLMFYFISPSVNVLNMLNALDYINLHKEQSFEFFCLHCKSRSVFVHLVDGINLGCIFCKEIKWSQDFSAFCFGCIEG